ncbi:uncharacterized protein [Eurosta solidaginis]|uniref:uncharacterized protein n=1 Tax=Eurosta solidaginis TaxID=178769 RepID=UPI003530B274
MNYYIYDTKTEDFDDRSPVMSRSTNSSKALLTKDSSELRIHYILWPFIIAVNLYDFLGLCHLVPTHNLHLYRPFMMSTSSFQVFHRTQAQTMNLPMISK